MQPVTAVDAMMMFPRFGNDCVAMRYGIQGILHHERYVSGEVDIDFTAIVTMVINLEFMRLSGGFGIAD